MKFLVTAVCLTLALSYLLLRFGFFSGGIILGEPDELVHAEVVRSLIKSGIPAYGNQGFYFEMPGYFAAAAAVSVFTGNYLESLRLVSFVSTVLTSLLIGFYLGRKIGRVAGIFGSTVYLLIPLVVFYLRVGVIEPFLVFGITGALVFFDLGRSEKNILYSFVSGIFLGLALLTKYTVLPIFLIILLISFIDLFKSNRHLLKERHLRVDFHGFLPLSVSLVLFLPVFYYFYRVDPVSVKWQTKQILGLYGGVKQELRLNRLEDFTWWFSWPVMVLSLVGLLCGLIKFKKYGIIVFCFLIMLLTILFRLPFYPRYALILPPFFVVFLALSLVLFRFWKSKLVLILLMTIIMLPQSSRAFAASYQTLVERSIDKFREYSIKPPWVFSNYWPNYFGKLSGTGNFSWVTYSNADLQSFAKGQPGNSLSILKETGGVVFLENLYADLYLTQAESRLDAIKDVRGAYGLSASVETPQSNFPFTRKSGNRIDIYVINKQ